MYYYGTHGGSCPVRRGRRLLCARIGCRRRRLPGQARRRGVYLRVLRFQSRERRTRDERTRRECCDRRGEAIAGDRLIL